jgi:hypothetical protein
MMTHLLAFAMLFNVMLDTPTNVSTDLCRQYDLQGDFASEKARYAADLTQGNWLLETERLDGGSGRMIFHDFGLADEIILNQSGDFSYNRVLWTIEIYNNTHFLVITHLDREAYTNLYKIDFHCKGIDLTDAASHEVIHLKYDGVKDQSAKVKAHYLTGAWMNMDYPFEVTKDIEGCGTFEPMQGAFMQISFWENGTFVREYGNAGKTVSMKGYWDITPDGRYLLLHYRATEGDASKTVVAELMETEDGILRILHKNEPTDGDDFFCTSTRIFTFQRWSDKK